MKRWSAIVPAVLLMLPLMTLGADSLRSKLTERLSEQQRLILAVTEEDEIAVGRQVAANLLGVAPLVEDEKVQRYVNTVGRWVAMQSSRPDLPWHFGVIDSADVNAFAGPGGYILLTRGLYASLGDEAELAGVLAHEIAHVVERHHIDLMRKTALIEEGRKALEKQVDDKDEWISRLVGSGAQIFARRLDQDAEFEADRMGVVLAVRAGYGAYGLPAVLQKIGSVAQTDDRVQLLFKTHPPVEARLRMLDRAMGPQFHQYERPGAGGTLVRLK